MDYYSAVSHWECHTDVPNDATTAERGLGQPPTHESTWRRGVLVDPADPTRAVGGVRYITVFKGEPMELLELLRSDDRAVSPVLGVALLIAMTVILAGVVGFVALGVDAQDANAPQATLDFEQAATLPGNVSLVHDGGDRLTGDNIQIKVNDVSGGSIAAADLTGTTVTTGDEVTVATDAEATDTVKIVWNDPRSDREVLLAEYTVE